MLYQNPEKSRDFIFKNPGIGIQVQSRDPGIFRDKVDRDNVDKDKDGQGQGGVSSSISRTFLELRSSFCRDFTIAHTPK